MRKPRDTLRKPDQVFSARKEQIMPPIKPIPDPEEPRIGPDATPIVNEQDRPTGGLLDPASQRGLPNPLAEAGPLRTPFPTVDLTEGLQNQSEPDEQTGVGDSSKPPLKLVEEE